MSEAARITHEPELFHVEPRHLIDIWAQVHPQIEAACDDTLTPDEVLAWLQEGRAALWLIVVDGQIQASCVHRICESDSRRWLDVVTLGGRGFKRWIAFLHGALEAAVAHHDCAGMACSTVRPGIEKWLRELGWQRHSVEMRWNDG